MSNIVALIYRGHDALQRAPLGPRACGSFLQRNLPTVRVFSSEDMVDAINNNRDQAINRFWDRYESLQRCLGPRSLRNHRHEVAIAFLYVLCPLGFSYAMTAAIYTGLKTCAVASRLQLLGRNEAARNCIKANAFEVFWTLRLCENLALYAATVGCIYEFSTTLRRRRLF